MIFRMVLRVERKNCAKFVMEFLLTIVDNCQPFIIAKSTCILDISVVLYPLLDTYLMTKSKQVLNKETYEFHKENR